MAGVARKVTDDDVMEIGGMVGVVVKSLVKNRDAVSVEADKSSHRIQVLFSVDPDDAGRVIGFRGITIKALRDIVRSSASSRGIHVELVFKNDRANDDRLYQE